MRVRGRVLTYSPVCLGLGDTNLYPVGDEVRAEQRPGRVDRMGGQLLGSHWGKVAGPSPLRVICEGRPPSHAILRMEPISSGVSSLWEGTLMDNEPSLWAAGWSTFAGVMMILGGIYWGIVGLIGLANDEFFVVGQEYVFKFDITTWGWIHLILGIVVAIAGFLIFSGAVWARTVGVIIAGLWALAAFAWLPWYPIWAIILIAIAVSVIWALTVHGRDVAAT